jgi:hypothetical protein
MKVGLNIKIIVVEKWRLLLTSFQLILELNCLSNEELLEISGESDFLKADQFKLDFGLWLCKRKNGFENLKEAVKEFKNGKN